jgi:hypothetical protein
MEYVFISLVALISIVFRTWYDCSECQSPHFTGIPFYDDTFDAENKILVPSYPVFAVFEPLIDKTDIVQRRRTPCKRTGPFFINPGCSWSVDQAR